MQVIFSLAQITLSELEQKQKIPGPGLLLTTLL
jgi:hypothetical protein